MMTAAHRRSVASEGKPDDALAVCSDRSRRPFGGFGRRLRFASDAERGDQSSGVVVTFTLNAGAAVAIPFLPQDQQGSAVVPRQVTSHSGQATVRIGRSSCAAAPTFRATNPNGREGRWVHWWMGGP